MAGGWQATGGVARRGCKRMKRVCRRLAGGPYGGFQKELPCRAGQVRRHLWVQQNRGAGWPGAPAAAAAAVVAAGGCHLRNALRREAPAGESGGGSGRERLPPGAPKLKPAVLGTGCGGCGGCACSLCCRVSASRRTSSSAARGTLPGWPVGSGSEHAGDMSSGVRLWCGVTGASARDGTGSSGRLAGSSRGGRAPCGAAAGCTARGEKARTERCGTACGAATGCG